MYFQLNFNPSGTGSLSAQSRAGLLQSRLSAVVAERPCAFSARAAGGTQVFVEIRVSLLKGYRDAWVPQGRPFFESPAGIAVTTCFVSRESRRKVLTHFHIERTLSLAFGIHVPVDPHVQRL